jgi:hypothetical protein
LWYRHSEQFFLLFFSFYRFALHICSILRQTLYLISCTTCGCHFSVNLKKPQQPGFAKVIKDDFFLKETNILKKPQQLGFAQENKKIISQRKKKF